ncbi:hypothetical protein [Streptomyces sp. NPDC048442]|uniref:hypothetical protein n=1 Tax=Streptomyces sp. NPDC048442 TaxID=3154823 RepID=UPI00342DA40F
MGAPGPDIADGTEQLGLEPRRKVVPARGVERRQRCVGGLGGDGVDGGIRVGVGAAGGRGEGAAAVGGVPFPGGLPGPVLGGEGADRRAVDQRAASAGMGVGGQRPGVAIELAGGCGYLQARGGQRQLGVVSGGEGDGSGGQGGGQAPGVLLRGESVWSMARR